MFNIGITELLVIFFIVLLLFGAKNIPEIAKGLGKGIRLFKSGLSEADKEIRSLNDAIDQDKTKS